MTPLARLTTVDADVDRLRRLTEIGRALTYATTLEQVALIAVERGSWLVDASAAVLMLPDAEGLLQVRASHGIDDALIARFREPLTDETIERLRGLLAVPDDSFIAVPLVAAGEVTGLLAVAFKHSASGAEEWLLSALADHVAVALENARLSGEVRLEMEERLRASEGADSSKDRALATLAHDIKSPIGAIDGYASNMEEGIYGPVTDAQRKVLNRVRMSGRHLLSLLDNVLDMARLNAGTVSVRAEPVRLATVAREAVDILRPAADARLQTLELRVAPGTEDLVVSADQPRVRQVLVNLIGNAVKFTPEHGAITVSTSCETVAGVTWGEVLVADNGPGIAPDEQRAIFEPYYRSDGTAIVPGVGLGLAISQSLVKQMGGGLAVRSNVGAGATFAIRFPARTRSPSDRRRAPTPPLDVPATPSQPQP
jgi:signal transduction histidine kinase